MAERAITPTPKTYAELRRAVEFTLIKGQQEVEQAKVRTYWDTGRLIHEHVLLFKERADYGAGTIAQLSADMEYHRSTLQRCVQFYLAISNCAARRNLMWGHYKELITVMDSKLRRTLADEANLKEWSVAQLKERITELVPPEAIEVVTVPAGEPQELLKPIRGTPGLHPIVDRGDGPVVDLGFRLYRELSSSSRLGVNDIVRLDDNGVRRVEGATKAELFTYAATIRRVIDGDTFAVALAVAPGITLELKLRLRGLDCPELSTAAGRAAKRFVDGLVRAGDEVVVSTTKPDKYDRYLADVFVRAVSNKLKAESSGPKAEDPPAGKKLNASSLQPTAEDEVFLNNALLSNGHAVRYDGEGPKE